MSAGEIANEVTFSESPEAPRIGFYPASAIDPSDGKLYFGTWRLFVSPDEGLNWNDPSDGKDLTMGHTSFGADVLTAIGVGPAGTNVLYTGSAQGRVMVTSDGGTTWKDITQGLPQRFITSILVAPADADRVYVTVSGFGTGHVFRSLGGGDNWQNVSAGLPNVPVNALLAEPVRARTLYAGTDIGVFITQDDKSSL